MRVFIPGECYECTGCMSCYDYEPREVDWDEIDEDLLRNMEEYD